MCGIIGYIGSKSAPSILLDGLRRLEYRGYDSSGMAIVHDDVIQVRKCAGRIENLRKLVATSQITGSLGISHTRWATHGEPNDTNAHPHLDQSGKLALVHNGVIENYRELRKELEQLGYTFQSETDSEVLTQLIGHCYSEARETSAPERLTQAIRKALSRVTGTYGIAVTHTDVPDVIMGARLGSPLVVGLGEHEHFIASDVSAMIAHTREAVYLNDGDLVTIQRDGFQVSSLAGGEATYEISEVELAEDAADIGDYPHYMLKEIHEQPQVLRDAMRGRLSKDEATAMLGGLQMTPRELRDVDRIILTGCGTASHAAMVGEYLLESLARIPTEVEISSEFRYRNIPTDKNTLQFVISQSGETLDSLAALREGKRKGCRVLGIVNGIASTIARESDGGVYMHAGIEIGVAATKTFTSQVTILTLLSLLLGRIHHLSTTDGLELISELEKIPEKIQTILDGADQIKEIAKRYCEAESMLFMGRQFNYPIALEAALKMKEISYVQASGHASGELKHGVIALVTENVPSIFIAPNDAVYEKNVSNIEEVKARKGPVIAITTEDKNGLEHICDDVICIPKAPPSLTPLLSIVPLQLFSYYVAVERGCDVDKPRNLAKSVTVE
jgi:glucosamine--fructose-6-phosphate aminotransferase (isomerizing)